MLKQLRDLEVAPIEDTVIIKRVRQPNWRDVWQVLHPKEKRGNDRWDRMLATVPVEEIEQLETEAVEPDWIS